MSKNLFFKAAVMLVCCFGLSFSVKSQIFAEGDRVANLGVGLLDFSGSGYSFSVPISASVEWSVKEHLFDENSSLGFGGLAGYYANKYTVKTANDGNYGWNYSHFLLGARGLLHYQFIDDLDTYAGLMLGWDIVSSSSFGTNSAGSKNSAGGFVPGLFIGGRYYFARNFSAFAELGYGISALQLGISFKF
jgi:hypothetical protein